MLYKDMLYIPEVTLVTVTGTNYRNHLKALLYSSQYIQFGKVLLLCGEDCIHTFGLNARTGFYNYHTIPKITSKAEYSYFMIYELHRYIHTDFCLVIQPDGFIINPDCWQDKFLNYDYIGAPWPPFYHDLKGTCHRVGNGGFSLRSKKLLEVPLNDPFEMHIDTLTQDAEDVNICCYRREIYERNGCKFAPIEIAKYFSHENTTMVPEIGDLKPFGFHTCYGYQNEDITNKFYFPTFL